MLYNRTNWSDPTLGQASLRPKANWPPDVFVSYGTKLGGMPFGVGAAFLVPAGGSLLWPTGWAGAERIQSVELRGYAMQLGAGIQPIDMLKVGAALVYYRISESLSQQLNFISSQGLASLGLAGGGFTFAVSGEFHAPGIPLTVGVNYHHQAPLSIDGHAHFDGVPPEFSPTLQDQAAHERRVIPNNLHLGAAYDITPTIKVMASWNLERWSVYRDDTYVGDKGLTIVVPRNYNNAWVYRLGGEYKHLPFWDRLTLRAGILRSISEQPTDTISPTLTDGNSWALSAGFGIDIGWGLRADLGYQYAFFDTVTATGVEAFPGSYDSHAHLLAGGIQWRPKF
jgi:long-subunit fatty acid transport protein